MFIWLALPIGAVACTGPTIFSHLSAEEGLWHSCCATEIVSLDEPILFIGDANKEKINMFVHRSNHPVPGKSQGDKMVSVTIVTTRLGVRICDLSDPGTRADHWRP